MDSKGPPAWAPAFVGAAARHGPESDDDLLTGRAWAGLLDRLAKAGELVRSDPAPDGALDRTAGYRHLLVLLALGIDEALRSGDPYAPQIRPGVVDNVLKWGMDCPDAAYLGAGIRGTETYRVTGNRGTVRYLGFQVMGGMESAANVVADDLDIGPDGTFTLLLSSEEQPGNWMPLSPHASALIVRQFFYDWEKEDPAQLEIECLTPRDAAPGKAPFPKPSELARQLVALGEFVDQSVRFWMDIEESGRAQGVNVFRLPSARTDMGGAAENVTVWGSWQLGDDEALLIEVPIPEALYWSVSVGNYWWETIDYANHQSSLNGHQAVVDRDGSVRLVVSHRDPGVANWLDTAGHRQGPMIFRWLRAADSPVPATRVVPFGSLDAVLPAETVRIDENARRQVLEGRRAGVRARFVRS
jgi:hypothetical protein